jgi:glyoxylase-like metal-dependent hydrolase (beta-lactamase superfamily II)
MIMFAVLGGDHPVMVDTGTPEAEFVHRHQGYRNFERPADEEPRKVLREAGIDPAEVRDVIFTHLHWDHCSNVELFPNARFWVQEDELRYAIKPIKLHRRAYQHLPPAVPSWFSVLNRLHVINGTAHVAPGISTVLLPGHTPGSQGALIETDANRYLIAGDCLDTYDNWKGDSDVPHLPSWSFTDVLQFDASFRKIEQLHCDVIPSHDQAVLDTGTFG